MLENGGFERACSLHVVWVDLGQDADAFKIQVAELLANRNLRPLAPVKKHRSEPPIIIYLTSKLNAVHF